MKRKEKNNKIDILFDAYYEWYITREELNKKIKEINKKYYEL